MFNSSKRPLLPSNIENLKPYIAGKTIEEVQAEYQPEQISKLASNENRLGCSLAVSEAVNAALGQIQNYPDPIARKLRTAIADKNGVQPKNVIIAAGSER